MHEFEFDERKSEASLDKRGIDLVAAQALWDDPYLSEIPARTEDEPRLIVIGRIAGRHWSAIVTPRAGKLWMISVRRARAEEVRIYEG